MQHDYAPEQQQTIATDHDAWVKTVYGNQLNLIAPESHQIQIADIAHHLAYINRYNGATMADRGLSLAVHAFFVSNYLYHKTKDAQLALHALLHSAYKAYIGDLIAPVKAIPELAEPYEALCNRVQNAILNALDIPAMTAEQEEQIREARKIAKAIEVERYMTAESGFWFKGDINTKEFKDDYVVSHCSKAKSDYMSAYIFLSDKLKKH